MNFCFLILLLGRSSTTMILSSFFFFKVIINVLFLVSINFTGSKRFLWKTNGKGFTLLSVRKRSTSLLYSIENDQGLKRTIINHSDVSLTVGLVISHCLGWCWVSCCVFWNNFLHITRLYRIRLFIDERTFTQFLSCSSLLLITSFSRINQRFFSPSFDRNIETKVSECWIPTLWIKGWEMHQWNRYWLIRQVIPPLCTVNRDFDSVLADWIDAWLLKISQIFSCCLEWLKWYGTRCWSSSVKHPFSRGKSCRNRFLVHYAQFPQFRINYFYAF